MFESLANKKVIPVLLAGTIGGSMLAGCGGSSKNEGKPNKKPAPAAADRTVSTLFRDGVFTKKILGCEDVGCEDITITKSCVGTDLETVVHTVSIGTWPDSQQSGGTDNIYISHDQAFNDPNNPVCADGELTPSDMPSH